MLSDVLASSSPAVLCALAVFLLVAGVAKGSIGFGMPTIALPLLSMLIDMRAAVMLLALPLILSNIPQALAGGGTLACLARLAPVLLGMVPGIFLGVYVLLHGDAMLTKLIAGSVIVLVGGLTWVAPPLRVRPGLHTATGMGTGFLAGVLGGVAAMSGPLVFSYLLATGLHGKAFVKQASLYLVVSSALLAVFLSSSSQFNAADLGISAVALLPVSLGMLLGQKYGSQMPADIFKRAVLLIVLLSGMGLVFRALIPQ